MKDAVQVCIMTNFSQQRTMPKKFMGLPSRNWNTVHLQFESIPSSPMETKRLLETKRSLENVLVMKSGDGDTSYAHVSSFQMKIIEKMNPF